MSLRQHVAAARRHQRIALLRGKERLLEVAIALTQCGCAPDLVREIGELRPQFDLAIARLEVGGVQKSEVAATQPRAAIGWVP